MAQNTHYFLMRTLLSKCLKNVVIFGGTGGRLQPLHVAAPAVEQGRGTSGDQGVPGAGGDGDGEEATRAADGSRRRIHLGRVRPLLHGTGR